MKIPYGQSNFAMVRDGQAFYVDKTPFIPQLESGEAGYRYLFFLRPRRMGKSLLVSMLEHYYDLARKSRFDDLFGGLWIHEHPTPEQGRHLALTLDFSAVSTEGDAVWIRDSFLTALKNCMRPFLLRYRDRLPDLARLELDLDRYQDPAGLIGALLGITGGIEHKLYLLIDEYDHFSNRLLSDGQQALYEEIVRGTGFVRTFYAALKVGTASGALHRMFITGVSPILLDDLSSGFNIITPVSLHARFNTLVGFTSADVERAVDEFLAGKAELREDPRIGDRGRLLETLERYYDGYRFAPQVTERVFNSDLVLYFLRQLENNGHYPDQMMDINVRTDYGRIQRIVSISGAAGAQTRGLLESILVDGSVASEIVEQFGVRAMYGRAQLVSLFFYMGMLTFGPESAGSALPQLVIPNRVIRTLQWEYLSYAMQDQDNLWFDMTDVEDALHAMAKHGDIQPFVALFRTHVLAKIGVKDQRQFNEGTLKLMMLAYLSNSRIYHVLSEKEFARGYCDLFLTPARDIPGIRHAWMLEVKYLKTGVKQADIDRAVKAAYLQLERYASDATFVPVLTQGRELRAGALLFAGAKDVLFFAWPPPPAEEKPPAKKPAGRPAKTAPAKKALAKKASAEPAKKAARRSTKGTSSKRPARTIAQKAVNRPSVKKTSAKRSTKQRGS